MASFYSVLAPRPLPLGRLVFDPMFILSQICVMQSLFYLSLGLFLFVADTIFDRQLALDQFFNAHALTLHTWQGAATMLCHFLTVLPGAWALLCVVERSKRCLDFVVTMHAVHLVACWAWGAFPGTFEWWALCVINVTTTTLIGEYLCVRRELREIPLQNPDEQHFQQSRLVRQKQQEMSQASGSPAGIGGASGRANSPAAGGTPAAAASWGDGDGPPPLHSIQSPARLSPIPPVVSSASATSSFAAAAAAAPAHPQRSTVPFSPVHKRSPPQQALQALRVASARATRGRDAEVKE